MLLCVLLAHAETPLRLALETDAGLDPLPWVVERHEHGRPEPTEPPPEERVPRTVRDRPGGMLGPEEHVVRVPVQDEGPYRVDLWWADPDDGTDWFREAHALRTGASSALGPADRSWTTAVQDGAVVVDLATVEPLRTPVLVRVGSADGDPSRTPWASLVQRSAVAVHQLHEAGGSWFLAHDRQTGAPAPGVVIRRGSDASTTDADGQAYLPASEEGEGLVVDDGTWLSLGGTRRKPPVAHRVHPGWRMGVDRDHLAAGDVVQVAGWVASGAGEPVRWELRVNREVHTGPVQVGPTGAYGFELTVPEAETGIEAWLSLVGSGPEGDRELARRRLWMRHPPEPPFGGLRIEALDPLVGAGQPIRFRIHTGSPEPTEVDLLATYAPAQWPVGGDRDPLHMGPWRDPLPPMDNGQRLHRTVMDGELVTLHPTEVPPYPVWLTLRPQGPFRGPTASVQVATADHLLGIERSDWGRRAHTPDLYWFSALDLHGRPVVGVPIQVRVEKLDRIDGPFPQRTPVGVGCELRTKPSDGGESSCRITFPEAGAYAIVATSVDAVGRSQRTEIREWVDPHPLHGPTTVPVVDARHVDVRVSSVPRCDSPGDPPHRRVGALAKVPVAHHPQAWGGLHDGDWAWTWRPLARDEISGHPLVLRIDPPLRPAQVWVRTFLDGHLVDQRTGHASVGPLHVTIADEALSSATAGELLVDAVAVSSHAPFDAQGWPTVDPPRPHGASGRWVGAFDPHRSLRLHLRGLRADECPRGGDCDEQVRIVVRGEQGPEPTAELMVALDLGPSHGLGADPLPEWLGHRRSRGPSSYGNLPWPSSEASRHPEPDVRDLPRVRDDTGGGFGGRLPAELLAADRFEPVRRFTGVVPTDADGGYTLTLPKEAGSYRLWAWARTPEGRTGRLEESGVRRP